jgi:hypothetical protein
MKPFLKLILLLFAILALLTKSERGCCQNLVPNPSFEDTVNCPHSANQLNNAADWSVTRGSPDYFNQCDFVSGTTAVPNNFQGYQFPHSGVAYAGFIGYYKPSPNIREHFTCQLINPLIIGKQYEISFYISLAGGISSQIASNKIGGLFSTSSFSISNNSPIDNYCQFHTDSVVIDTMNWIFIKGKFIADSSYNYLTIGNFFTDSLTDTIMLNPFTSYAYYYIDDISVVQDSITDVNEITLENQEVLFPNPTNNIIYFNIQKNLVKNIIISNSEFKVLKENFNNNIESNFKIDLSEYSNGVYYLIVLYKNKPPSYHKIVKL